MNKKTSIKDSNNNILCFVGNQQWGGFLLDGHRECHEFANEQGPELALLTLEACGYGGSVAAGVLHGLIRDLADEATQAAVPHAEVADDPETWTSTQASKKALEILNAIARTGLPLAPEIVRAADALEEYAERIQAEAEAAADRKKLEAEAYEFYRVSCEATDTVPAPDWVTAKSLTVDVERDFLAIARAARTMHGVQA